MRLIIKILVVTIIGFFTFFISVTYGQVVVTIEVFSRDTLIKKQNIQYNQFRDYVEWCEKYKNTTKNPNISRVRVNNRLKIN